MRINNIQAAKAVADAVRTSLGPRGMDKMVGDSARCISCHRSTCNGCDCMRGANVKAALEHRAIWLFLGRCVSQMVR